MGFGVNIKVEVPKVEPAKVDVAAATAGVTGAVSGAVDSATKAVTGAVGAVTEAVAGAAAVAAGGAAALSSVAGALVDVDVSFKGEAADLVLEPHLQLEANASYEETEFEKGPIYILIDLTRDEAARATDVLHVFSASGSYDQQKRICDDFHEDDTDTTRPDDGSPTPSLFVKFEEAPMSETYSLEVIQDDDKRYLVFQDVSYGNLNCDAMNREDYDFDG
jgi:hypothetical protein